MSLKTRGHWFIDEEGRSVLLRGVNLGGSTKVPFAPNGATHIKTDFLDHQKVSFIGRPFPSDEAQEHLERLKHWGFNCLRFLTTWEAIEHKGPKDYDTAYLDYLKKMVQLVSDLGFYIFIDPHQDVWSRMTGGDGAPGWLFEKVGLDFTKFDITDAALVMQYRYPHDYPPMYWAGNMGRFAAATMFTLFFGGNDFAPKCSIDGSPIQDYMQSHYINSIKQIAIRCKDISNVIGYDSLNEPGSGFIGSANIQELEGLRPPGLWFSPFHAMITASGIPCKVPIYAIKGLGLKKVGEKLVNPERISCWLPNCKDIWRDHRIWDLDFNGQPQALKTEYFSKSASGHKVNFFQDYVKPFIQRFTEEIRSIIPDTLIFIEGEPLKPGELEWRNLELLNIVNSTHWYDNLTLLTKKFRPAVSFDISTSRPVFGSRRIKNMFKQQLGRIKEQIQDIPTLIGEFGLPYDLDHKRAYKTGNFSTHIKALKWYYEALDYHMLHSTQWNYTADNNNEWGDLWNLEDLSIFSRDQQKSPNNIDSGGRAIEGFCRPYVQKTAGIPLKTYFDLKKKEFTFIFEADREIKEPTEVFIPKIQYPRGFEVKVIGGEFITEFSEQFLRLFTKESVKYEVKVRKK